MSVTVSPTNNIEFCQKNNLITICKEECCEWSDCHFCHGTNEYETKIYPFEMNLSNGNFSTLWNSLGLDFDYCGEISPEELRDSLLNFDEELLLRANHVEANENGDAHFISFGIDRERAIGYNKRLKAIVAEAFLRKTTISWG